LKEKITKKVTENKKNKYKYILAKMSRFYLQWRLSEIRRKSTAKKTGNHIV